MKVAGMTSCQFCRVEFGDIDLSCTQFTEGAQHCPHVGGVNSYGQVEIAAKLRRAV
ncbi:MAG: hypothetical protein N3D11_13545 [Candidatus Sumerlaeia bacterium]|nr:hypothetical protein [Candidatus Sumerlaeia bacterium]